jgi:hypothetical protein
VSAPVCCGRPKVLMRYLKSGRPTWVCPVFLARHPEEFAPLTEEVA